MVEAFVGLVGGGKSYCSVRRMCSYMALGGRVCSNIKMTGYSRLCGRLCPWSPVFDFMRGIGWEYQDGQYTYIDFDEMVESPAWFKRIPAGVSRDNRTLLVIDEATDLFDNLDRGKAGSDSVFRELFRFLRLSRHAHIDVLFICQDLSAINSRLRGLVSGIWRSTDMRNFRLARLHIKFPFDLFLLQKFDRKGTTELSREWVKKDKKVFGIYTSEAFGGAVGVKWDGVSISRDAGTIIKKVEGWPMWVKVAVAVLALFNGYLGFVMLTETAPGQRFGVGVVTNVVERVVVSNVVQAVTGKPVGVYPTEAVSSRPLAPRVVRGSYSVSSGCSRFGGQVTTLDFDGVRYVVGSPCEWGIVTAIDKRFSKVTDLQGGCVWLLPAVGESANNSRGDTSGLQVANISQP